MVKEMSLLMLSEQVDPTELMQVFQQVKDAKLAAKMSQSELKDMR